MLFMAGMPTWDAINTGLNIANLSIAGVQLLMFLALIAGGWVTILRSLGFYIDKYAVSFIEIGFEYFTKIVAGNL